jgi:hypothetical protein
VPAAVKLQEEYGDAIQVIFVHSQRATQEQATAFALNADWLGNQAIWTSNRPFSTGSNGLPSFALLDASGKVVLKGNSTSLKGKIEDEIERMIKENGAAPEGAPKAVGKVYKAIGKGDLAKAAAEAAKLKAKPGSKEPEEVVSAADAALDAIEFSFASKLQRADWLMQNGDPIGAEERLEVLAKSVKGHEDMSGRVAEAMAKLETAEMQEAMGLAKDYAKLEAKLYAKPDDEKAKAKLAEFAQENAGNAVGKRAQKLVEVANTPVPR